MAGLWSAGRRRVTREGERAGNLYEQMCEYALTYPCANVLLVFERGFEYDR